MSGPDYKSNPFTFENHLAFIQERQRLERERTNGNLVKFDEHPGTRALRRMITLKKKYNDDMDKVREVMGSQYDVADSEFVCRAGDPNRFNEKTGGWVIWP